MKKKASLDEFNGLVAAIGQSIYQDVKLHVRNTKWKSAFYDERASRSGGSRLGKLRIELPNGKIADSAPQIADEATLKLFKLWRMKDDVSPRQWFGIRITVFPDGTCEATFNYDPHCGSEPGFVDV